MSDYPKAMPAAADYDCFYRHDDHRQPPGFEASVVHLLSRHLALGGRVLDTGCGTGALTAVFAKSGYRAIGLDRSTVAIRRARSAHPEGRYLLSDARQAPFPPRTFEALVCSALSLFNVPDLNTAQADAQSLAGLVRPGGWFVYLGSSALRPNVEPAPSWYHHTLPQFRRFLVPLGDLVLLRVTAYRLIRWWGASAWQPPLCRVGRAWVRATRRPGAVLGLVRVV